MGRHSRDTMVVLAAPAPPAASRLTRLRARAAVLTATRRARIVSAGALAACVLSAATGFHALGDRGGPAGRDVALLDATPRTRAVDDATRYTRVPGGATSASASQPQAPGTSSPPPVAAAPASAMAAGGIPIVALQAYQNAAAAAAASIPSCGLAWPLLAAIGRVESNHGRTSGPLLVDGTSSPPVMGILLSGGNGFATIRDTDGGRLDGDASFDRAVGPMQFIPSTWAMYESDGNGDGRADPFNIHDAALAAARYLCRAGGDLRSAEGLQRAVYSYNHDQSYVIRVLALADEYAVAFHENRLPITAVTDVPAPGETDLPPASVGSGGQPAPPADVPGPPGEGATSPGSAQPSPGGSGDPSQSADPSDSPDPAVPTDAPPSEPTPTEPTPTEPTPTEPTPTEPDPTEPDPTDDPGTQTPPDPASPNPPASPTQGASPPTHAASPAGP